MQPTLAPPPAADLVDVGDVGRMIARGWRVVLGTVAVCVGLALAVLTWAPRRFQGDASIVVRSSENGSSLLGRMGIPADLAGGAGGLGGALKSPLETELQILGSQSVLRAVSDSLGLQARVVSPGGRAPWQLVRPIALRPSFRKTRLRADREGNAWRVTGDGLDVRATQGVPFATPVGTVALATGSLPSRFEVELLDREDGLRRLQERLSQDKKGGEVLDVAYAAPDSLSASAVPNAIIDVYLQRRRTTDRGVNQHRAEFLTAQVDSVNFQLAAAEQALRRYQESSGVVDPELMAKLDLETVQRTREQLAANEVEGRALESMLRQIGAGTMSARQLAAFPSFLRSPAINEILTELTKLEAERTRALSGRTEAEPDIQAMSTSIRDLERQLQPLGASYAGSLTLQHDRLAQEVARFDTAIERLPESAQSFVRLQRDVRRLTQTSLALQTQLLEARLSAIGEGGDVRRLDVAEPPKRPVFPRPLPTLAAGLGAGLGLGLVLAVAIGFATSRVDEPATAMRLTGIPTVALGRSTARFLAALQPPQDVAVVPLDELASGAAVAGWLGAGEVSAEPVAVRPALAVSAGRGGPRSDARERVDLQLGQARSALALLPALTEVDSAYAVESGQRVVLAVSAGCTRAALVEGIAAVRTLGARPVGIVLT